MNTMKWITAIASISLLTACGGTGSAIPQEAKVSDAAATTTCDRAREAFLTGSETKIQTALEALMNDKTADGTAREYADYYLNRDNDNSASSRQLRDMDKGIIRIRCSL